MFKKDWFNQMKRQTSTKFAIKHRIEHMVPEMTKHIVSKRFEVETILVCLKLFRIFLQQIIKSSNSRLYNGFYLN